MTIAYEWRGAFTNAELTALHAAGFDQTGPDAHSGAGGGAGAGVEGRAVSDSRSGAGGVGRPDVDGDGIGGGDRDGGDVRSGVDGDGIGGGDRDGGNVRSGVHGEEIARGDRDGGGRLGVDGDGILGRDRDGGRGPGPDDWWDRVHRHSLGWVCARQGGALVGFVNVAWDGGSHAFVLDTVVDQVVRRQGVGARLVRLAADQARAAGVAWLHVDFEPHLRDFYLDACGFTPTHAGLIALDR
ncbi:GNAT family N-acetyltransferase [Asanoa sp. NPDC049518]|uniref:GNAT family N-acetyltransferase n=1 Tax=unclassified Asanoa TaxID=2685164 RepID=UPI00341E2C3A